MTGYPSTGVVKLYLYFFYNCYGYPTCMIEIFKFFRNRSFLN